MFNGQPIGHTGHVNEDRVRKRLTAVGANYQALRADLDKVRPELVTAIEAAIDVGLRQTEIVKLTGLTREYIRRIGVEMKKRQEKGTG